jgi:L-alanine-DL-glutamate epimerase-like enolase superfamily enzyme
MSATIAQIDVRYLALPTGIKEVKLPNGRAAATDFGILLVRLTDGDGTPGWSFVWGQVPRQLQLFEQVTRFLASDVCGHSLDEVPTIGTALAHSSHFLGLEGLCAYGISAYEMALEDLRCRRLGISLGALAGRKRTSMPTYQTGLFLWSTIDELVAEARSIYESGVHAIKMIVGKADPAEDLDRLTAVRDSLPSHVSLMADATQRWSYPQALRAAQLFVDIGLVWLEDPLRAEDLAGYERLAHTSPVPIATGENLYGLEAYRRLAESGIPYLVADLERVGGFGGWRRIAEVADDTGCVALPHLYPHASAQLMTTVPGKEVWHEYVPWFDTLVEEQLVFKDGILTVSDQPGAGFTPSADSIERLATSQWISLVDD